MERWYLACHKAGKYNVYRAQMAMERLSVSTFSPVIRCYRPRPDRPGHSRQIVEQLFPGYLFISFDIDILHTSKIEQCAGISHLVRFAGKISPIRDAVIDEVMRLPLCMEAFSTQKKGTQHQDRSAQRLNNEQRHQIQTLLAEKNGLARSAMFYAFAEALC